MATMKELYMQDRKEKAKKTNIRASIIIASIFIVLSIVFIIIGIPAMIASAALVMMDAFIVLILIYGIRIGTLPGSGGRDGFGNRQGIDVEEKKSPIEFWFLFFFYAFCAVSTFVVACVFTTYYFFGF